MTHQFKIIALLCLVGGMAGCAQMSNVAGAASGSMGGTSTAATGNESSQQDSLVRAYVAANTISFNDAIMRKDIGHRAIK